MKETRNSFSFLLRLSILLLLALVGGCAGKKVIYHVPTGETEIEMEASSFAFEPNDIHARTGETLLLKVKNIAGMEHNLTILDPDGTRIVDMDLPEGETTTINLPLTQAGTYSFHCDKPFHTSFGMKGRIVADGN